MEELDALLSAYDRRKAEEAAAEAEAQRVHREWKEQALGVLRQIVVPTLRPLVQSLSAKGHRAEVQEPVSDSTFLTTAFVFEVRVRGAVPSGKVSSLAFEALSPGELRVKKRVESPQAGSGYQSSNDWPIGGVSVDKVRSEALNFVESVLAVN